MAALDAAIHVCGPQEDLDGRVKPVQDDMALFPLKNVMLQALSSLRTNAAPFASAASLP